MPIPHPGLDVFDLLDEMVIRNSHDDFPGHAEARELAQAERERSGKHWKTLCQERFGLRVEVDTVSRIARDMRERGRVTAALLNVIDECERLSLFVHG